MADVRAAVLLPVDRATVVVPVPDPPNIILKHTDGELVQLTVGEAKEGGPVYGVLRRHELDATWLPDGGYTDLETAIVSITDRQAFGVRSGGDPTNLLKLVSDEPGGELFEIEPLHLGGILVDSKDHLPLILHVQDGSYWRLRHEPHLTDPDHDHEYQKEDGEGYVIEKETDTGNWETVKDFPWEVRMNTLLEEFAKCTGTKVSDPSAEAMQSALDKHVFWFDNADVEGVDDELVDRAGIQGKTVRFHDEQPDEDPHR